MSKILATHKVVMVDCDDTLILWDVSKYPGFPRVTIHGDVLNASVVVHQKNINTVRKLFKLGYTIVVWSQTGYDWAQKVATAVGLNEYVSLYMSKPRYYVDDLNCIHWMGEQIYRNPITGESLSD